MSPPPQGSQLRSLPLPSCPQLTPHLPSRPQADTLSPSRPQANTSHASLQYAHQDFWHSPEANLLFGLFKQSEDVNADIKEIMYGRLAKFKKAMLTCDGWKDVMEDQDSKNKCHQTFIFNIRKKCKYLYHAINIALKKKGGNSVRWQEICDEAADIIKIHEDNDNLPESHYPAKTWIKGKTIMRWFRQFRLNGESFINFPLRSSLLDKSPPFFDLNPTFKDRFLKHA